MFQISNDIQKEINDISGLHLEVDRDLTKFSTMKLKSTGSICLVETVDALKALLKILKDRGIRYEPIGWGANVILPEEPNTLFIKLNMTFDKAVVNPKGTEFWLPASAPLNILTSLASKYGFRGWEVFTGIPASLGGAIAMNAGTSLGEIGELVKEVRILRESGNLEGFKIQNNSFSYRKNHFLNDGDIIIEALLTYRTIDKRVPEEIKNYLEMRNNSQPLREKTCGCMFKNKVETRANHSVTCRAGQYIDIMGLKGLTIDGLRVSPKHANFMENQAQTSANAVKKLVSLTLRELELHYGVSFETEVRLPD